MSNPETRGGGGKGGQLSQVWILLEPRLLRMPGFTRSRKCSQVVPCLHEEEPVNVPREERKSEGRDSSCFLFSHSCR